MISITNQDEFDKIPLIHAWVHGWVLTRNKPPPQIQSYGYTIDLGQPDHLIRHVVEDYDRQNLYSLTTSLIRSGTWLKVCADTEQVALGLSGVWIVQPPEYLMAMQLKEAEIEINTDFQLSIETTDAVTIAMLMDKDGQLAARGCVAQINGYAMFDQIVTEPRHQRKGLGRVIMATLSNLSVAQTSTTGVLVATEDGLALYEKLGWALVSPMTAAVLA